uniref:Uncharacterized protein n=1 Tax=Cannabis sativa TaxID=3483 RepID=A0A803NXM9_CANSA
MPTKTPTATVRPISVESTATDYNGDTERYSESSIKGEGRRRFENSESEEPDRWRGGGNKGEGKRERRVKKSEDPMRRFQEVNVGDDNGEADVRGQ